MINLKESIVTTEMGFKSFSAILWLSVLTYSTYTISPIIFYADLRKGRDHIDSHSGITWKEDLHDPQAGSESCDVRGIMHIPFSSISSYLVKFTFNNSKPSGYNFHFSNGCGDGWGGTSRCYEVHNYERKVVVHPRKGTGNSTTLNGIVTKEIDVKIESGSVKVTLTPTSTEKLYTDEEIRNIVVKHAMPLWIYVGTWKQYSVLLVLPANKRMHTNPDWIEL